MAVFSVHHLVKLLLVLYCTTAVYSLEELGDREANNTDFEYEDTDCIDKNSLLSILKSISDLITTNVNQSLTNFKEEFLSEMFELKELIKDQCMYPFVNLAGQCVAVIQTYGSWNKQREECKKLGDNVDLLEVREKTLPLINRYMKEYAEIHSISKSVWIGGLRTNETTFEWPSGKHVSLSWGWYDGEPNNQSDDEVCMLMYIKEGEFNDESCSYDISALCEKIN